MFADNALVKKFEDEKRYDRFAIASTIFDASFKGAACSVIESHVLQVVMIAYAYRIGIKRGDK